jgi:excisionase family DNA binding protein
MNGFDALPELMTMDQLAERLGVTRRHVRRLIDERRVPFLRVGRFIRFDPAEISVWLDASRVSTSRPRYDPTALGATHPLGMQTPDGRGRAHRPGGGT